MKIFPAIDLIDGQAVRLSKGDYGKVKVYESNVCAVANGQDIAHLQFEAGLSGFSVYGYVVGVARIVGNGAALDDS